MLADFNSLALLSQRGATAGAITVCQAFSGEESNEKALQIKKPRALPGAISAGRSDLCRGASQVILPGTVTAHTACVLCQLDNSVTDHS